MTTTNAAMKANWANHQWGRLYRTSGSAALLAGAVLLVALIDLIATWLTSGAIEGGFTSIQNNWLVVIYKLLAGVSGFQIDRLQVLDFLDLGILALVAILHLGLYAALRKTSQIWCIIALVQPFLGIVLFLVTKSAGRSAVMGAGLVISAVMLRSNLFNKITAEVGLLACALLLAGDLSAGAIPPSGVVAALFGIAYVLLIAWLFRVGGQLLKAGGLIRNIPGEA
jgi:hypothetical protein